MMRYYSRDHLGGVMEIRFKGEIPHTDWVHITCLNCKRLIDFEYIRPDAHGSIFNFKCGCGEREAKVENTFKGIQRKEP